MVLIALSEAAASVTHVPHVRRVMMPSVVSPSRLANGPDKACDSPGGETIAGKSDTLLLSTQGQIFRLVQVQQQSSVM